MKKILIMIMPLLLTGFFSCKKTEIEEPPLPVSFADIKASPTFTWETSKEVILEIQGLAVPVKITHTLKVMTPDGDMLYQGLQAIDASSEIPLKIPTDETQIVVSCKTLIKTLDIVNGRAVFTYLPDTIEP